MSDAASQDHFSLFVGTPTLRGSFCKPYVMSIVEVQAYCLRNGFGFELQVALGISAIEAARNALANWFLFNSNATHLLFWDDDMGAVVSGLTRMFDYRDRDVVAALYPRKKLDMARVRQAVIDQPDIDPRLMHNIAGDFSGMFQPFNASWADVNEPIRLDRVGTGLMMISRDCLMRLIDSGNVSWTNDEAIRGGKVYDFFQSLSTENGRIGEDFYFCDVVRAHGGEVWGCPWVQSVHVGQIDVIGNLPALASLGMSRF